MKDERKDDGREEISYYDNDLGEMKFRVTAQKSRLFHRLLFVGVLLIAAACILGLCFDGLERYALGVGILGGVWILVLAPLFADWFAD